jgi:hypothetical protein
MRMITFYPVLSAVYRAAIFDPRSQPPTRVVRLAIRPQAWSAQPRYDLLFLHVRTHVKLHLEKNRKIYSKEIFFILQLKVNYLGMPA